MGKVDRPLRLDEVLTRTQQDLADDIDRHIRTRPYTPRTNGKAERFIQTLLREWAYAIPYRSSDSRNRDLVRYLDWYNTNRPHNALSRQPPAKRLSQLNNVLRNDS